jgi:hypothetical protein
VDKVDIVAALSKGGGRGCVGFVEFGNLGEATSVLADSRDRLRAKIAKVESSTRARARGARTRRREERGGGGDRESGGEIPHPPVYDSSEGL